MLLTARRTRGNLTETRTAECADIHELHDLADALGADGWTTDMPQATSRDAMVERMQSALIRIVDYPGCDARGIAATALGLPLESVR